MSVRGFFRTLLFGAVAAMGIIACQILFGPVFGSGTVLAVYWAAATVIYAGLLGESLRERVRNVVVAASGATIGLTLAEGFEGLAIGLVATLALVRSGLASRKLSPRGFALEVGLGLAALFFAGAVSSAGGFGMAIGIWSFALVESLYFLVPGTVGEPRQSAQGDAFDRAREQLLNLLEEA